MREELAGHGFDDVVQRDHALHLAVLVDHEDDVRAGGPELIEQFHAGERFGHVDRRLQVLCEVDRLATHHLGEDLLGADDAEDLIQPIPGF